MIDGLGAPGPGAWKIDKPLGTMFVWAKIPEPFDKLGSMEFAKRMIREASVAVSPGLGFLNNGLHFAPFTINLDQLSRDRVFTATRQRLVKAVRVFPDEFQIKHLAWFPLSVRPLNRCPQPRYAFR